MPHPKEEAFKFCKFCKRRSMVADSSSNFSNKAAPFLVLWPWEACHLIGSSTHWWNKNSIKGLVKSGYCWCFRNPVNSPVEVEVVDPIIYTVLYIPGGPKILKHQQYHQLSWVPLQSLQAVEQRPSHLAWWIGASGFGGLKSTKLGVPKVELKQGQVIDYHLFIIFSSSLPAPNAHPFHSFPIFYQFLQVTNKGQTNSNNLLRHLCLLVNISNQNLWSSTTLNAEPPGAGGFVGAGGRLLPALGGRLGTWIGKSSTQKCLGKRGYVGSTPHPVTVANEGL